MSTIINLQAANIKCLKAVNITPPKTGTVTVGGKNGAGKTTTLDLISMGLCGKSAICDQPVRRGQSNGHIIVNLGDLIAKRTFSVKKDEETGEEETTSKIVLSSPEGASYPSPQAILDKMYDKVAFDPLYFQRAEPAKQDAMLRALLGIDTTELDAKRKCAFDDRTDANRWVKQYEAQLAITPHHDGVPAEEQKSSAIIAEVDDAVTWNQARQDALDLPKELVEEGVEVKTRLQECEADILVLEKQLADAKAKRDGINKTLLDLRNQYDAAKAIADAYAPAKDVAAIRVRLDELDTINRKVRENKAYEELNVKLNTQRQKAHELDAKLEAIDGEKAKLMASAKFPVPGLSLGDGVVLFNGLPLDQASSAEQLRVSVAIGIAMNPKLKVLLIRDGSLLDSKSKAMIAEMASAAEAQVWIEEVAEPDASGKYPSDISVVIEDGEVKT